MITTTARVVSMTDGVARVASTAPSSCGSCQTRSHCGVAGLGKYFSGNRQPVSVPCDTPVSEGDALQVAMSETDFLKAGLLAYLLPSLCTIIGACLADAMAYGDAGAALGALAGLASGLLLLRIIAWTPVVTVRRVYGSFNQGELP